MWSTTNDDIANRTWLRRYSQHPRARSRTSRRCWAVIRESPIVRRPDPELVHQGRERHASQAGEPRQVLDARHLERLDLGEEAEQLGVLVRRERLVLALL